MKALLLAAALAAGLASMARASEMPGFCSTQHGDIIPISYCGRFSTPGGGGGGGGGGSGSGVATLPCQFFIAPTGGSDSNVGSSAAPFATLERARTAMQGAPSLSKVACLKAGSGGTYNRTSALSLGGADAGETWQFDPASGVNTATLDGGGTVDLILIGGNNITINGLKLQNPLGFAVATNTSNQITNLVLVNSDISLNHGTSFAFDGFPPCVAIDNAINSKVDFNYIHDCISMGVVFNAFSTGESIAGGEMVGNVVLRVCTQVSDCGGLYASMHGGEQGPAHTFKISNNFVRDLGAPGVSGVNDIYLDDNENNTDVFGNIVGPLAIGSINPGNLIGCGTGQAFCLHNGHDNHLFGNIIDLGLGANETIVTYGCDGATITGMGGNQFTGNIVIGNYAGSPNTGFAFNGNPGFFEGNGCPNGVMSAGIANNIYLNYGGGVISTSSDRSDHDTNPIHPTAAQLGCSSYLYSIASGSVAFNPPVNFTAIVGGWGPPGFVVPTSTNKSCPG